MSDRKKGYEDISDAMKSLDERRKRGEVNSLEDAEADHLRGLLEKEREANDIMHHELQSLIERVRKYENDKRRAFEALNWASTWHDEPAQSIIDALARAKAAKE